MSAVATPLTREAGLTLTVAGLTLDFVATPDLALARPGFEYPAFLDRVTGDRIPVAVVPAGETAIADEATLACDTGDGWQLFAAGARRWLCMPRRDSGGAALGGVPVWRAHWREPLREVTLEVAPTRDGVVRHVIQYPLDQILLTRALLSRGGLLIHAAGAATARGGVAFAGVSGAGKSTVTRMLQADAGLRFLSDDRVVLRPTDGPPRMHGTPWAGDAGVAQPDDTALTTLCFLRQAATPALHPLTAPQALERLLPVATLPWYDRAWVEPALDAAANLVSRVRCFDMAFTTDAAATRALLEGLGDAA